VAASDRDDLLGQYLLRLKLLTRSELDLALGQLRSYDGRLAEALVGLGLAERTAVSRAVRNLARDRVASVCGWREGQAQLYRGSAPASVDVPLDLDLTVPMMAGAIHNLARGEALLVTTLSPGRRHEDVGSPEERGSAPSSLLDLADLVSGAEVPLREISQGLIDRGKARERVVSEREAHAAVMVALALEWVRAK
jgi:hypothetical protein